MRWWIALAAVLGMSGPMPVAAQSIRDGNGFLSTCEDANAVSKAACLGYVGGLHDMGGYLWQSGRVRPEVCPPSSATLEQYLGILIKFLRDNPEQCHKPTGGLFWIAASKASPCSPR
jgi:hypothetical protein